MGSDHESRRSSSSSPPQIHVAVKHLGMRNLIVELLRREFAWCDVHEHDGRGAGSSGSDGHGNIDVVLIDEVDLVREVGEVVSRAIVIAPEPDGAYFRVAADAGAAGCLSRERIAEELPATLRRILGPADADQAVGGKGAESPQGTFVPITNAQPGS